MTTIDLVGCWTLHLCRSVAEKGEVSSFHFPLRRARVHARARKEHHRVIELRRRHAHPPVGSPVVHEVDAARSITWENVATVVIIWVPVEAVVVIATLAISAAFAGPLLQPAANLLDDQTVLQNPAAYSAGVCGSTAEWRRRLHLARRSLSVARRC